MDKITVSAPGKLMLLGEHAVVYGNPCVVTAVEQRLGVVVEKRKDKKIEITSPGVGDTRFVEAVASYFKQKYSTVGGYRIGTSSSFSGVFGFGSSSAVTVATMKALVALDQIEISNDELYRMCYEVVLGVQGVGSGFDVASAVYGGTIYYDKQNGKLADLTSEASGMEIVIGYSGTKSNTVDIVKKLAKQRDRNRKKIDSVFDEIEICVKNSRKQIGLKNWKNLGKEMSRNHQLLMELGVSTKRLDDMVFGAIGAGAYGAKLSGAGGGDCMIALTDKSNRKKIEKAIESVGGQVVHVGVNGAGVKLETTDDQSEMFIVVDKDDKVLGYRSRYDCHHDKSLIHRTVGALIFDSNGRLLLQRRSETKDTDPGKWAISCAGHVVKGQTDEEAIKRELTEELGVSVPLVFVKKFIVCDDVECERSVAFRGVYDGPFFIDKTEVSEVRFFTMEELRSLVKNSQEAVSKSSLATLREVGIL